MAEVALRRRSEGAPAPRARLPRSGGGSPSGARPRGARRALGTARRRRQPGAAPCRRPRSPCRRPPRPRRGPARARTTRPSPPRRSPARGRKEARHRAGSGGAGKCSIPAGNAGARTNSSGARPLGAAPSTALPVRPIWVGARLSSSRGPGRRTRTEAPSRIGPLPDPRSCDRASATARSVGIEGSVLGLVAHVGGAAPGRLGRAMPEDALTARGAWCSSSARRRRTSACGPELLAFGRGWWLAVTRRCPSRLRPWSCLSERNPGESARPCRPPRRPAHRRSRNPSSAGRGPMRRARRACARGPSAPREPPAPR